MDKEININEYDLITGMNLLHFTCKFGAKQIGYEKEAIQVMNVLIEKGTFFIIDIYEIIIFMCVRY